MEGLQPHPAAVELHTAATQLKDKVSDIERHLAAKQLNVVVAIERHDKNEGWLHAEEGWQSYGPQDHFVWVKAKTKVKISLLRSAYLNQYGNPPHLLTLDMGGSSLDDDIKIADLDCFKDRLIVLRARLGDEADKDRPMAASSSGDLGMDHSLSNRPDSTQTATARATTAPATNMPVRPPLQEVNRQLNLPPKPSADELIKGEPSPYDESISKDEGNVKRSALSLPPPAVSSALGIQSTPPEPTAFKPEYGAPSEGRVAPQTADETQEYQPREYGNPFAQPDEETEPVMRGQALRDLAQLTVPERLEAGVRAGVEFLRTLEAPLEQMKDHDDAENWRKQIERVREEAVKTRTVVGVVGNTGAGKSSVINAMLDEERLVPTNCMRACTAVVTELSYNDSRSEMSKYRAEIEFIQPEDWRKELNILFEEVFDDSGHVSKEVFNPDCQAGIAYAKIRAVYHRHTNDMLANATIDSLMRVKNVGNILGTTRRINERSPEAFYRRLQSFVDSKEKGTEKRDKNGNKITNPKREFEYWPLIKVVKIFTKADALSTGAVIVDLPGVQDSNAARAAVAEGYMKQCTGLWILAPINRAVDDKAAKTLLGNTFKRQLKYDGTYSAVTFICSKTDDISRTEAADSLQLGSEMDEIDEKLNVLGKQRKTLTREMNVAKSAKQDHAGVIEAMDDQTEIWEDLMAKLEDGQTVYPPKSQNPKRKRVAASPQPRKKLRRNADVDSEDQTERIVLDESSDEGADVPSGEPLTATQVEEKLDELKTLKREARREKGKIDEQITSLKGQLSAVENEVAELDARQSQLCIAGRNEYSRSAIQHDFAAGIRELDQENAEEEDPDNFNPDEDIRDYDEVARSLPVFCVSSRAYQQLSGRLQKDNEVAGFTAKDQTEIPQLQAHCKKLTERGRQANCRRFLNSLNQLLNSLGLWASDDGTGAKLTNQQRDIEQQFLVRRLKELEKALEKAVHNILEDAFENLDDQLFDKFQPAADEAISQALPTSSGWGAHKSEGGMVWSTYKATVRRNGVFQGSRGLRDFNAALSEPIYKHLASAWERTFQRSLPKILQSLTRGGSDLLKKFHAAVEARCLSKGHGLSRISLLANQLEAYEAIFNDLASAMIGQVNESQREINREFTPVITEAMERAYQLCTDERGQGSFKRMKSHMHEHIDTTKTTMFSAACDQVKNSLKGVCKEVGKTMLDRTDSVFVNMQRDYMSIIGGVNVGQVSLSREERTARREVDEAISAVDPTFQPLLDCDIAELAGASDDAEQTEAMEFDEQEEAEEEIEGDEEEGIPDDENKESRCDEVEGGEGEVEVHQGSGRSRRDSADGQSEYEP